VVLIPAAALAQIPTGSITGTVTDPSGAVLPGVTVSLSGERLIGGVQALSTDTTGTYRFDRLPPGMYTIKAELQGFKAAERGDIRISAGFVATVNLRLEVGQLAETVQVLGATPTVDTRSNVQQTIMGQEVLEVVPTGRDPWSLAKIIPGVAISTYDVGGTQSFQQSSLTAHGSSTNDVTYNIDGANINWPGGGGGATMIYYDQGMFEEVNYVTSAIPAETMVGGISINMVTKEAGNKWRGNAKGYFANNSLQADNWTNVPALQQWAFTGNPTKKLYDFNITGGGAIARDKLWVTGSLRRWRVDRLTAAKNADGSRAIDDNTLKNYSGKGVWQLTQSQKVSVSFNWNNKIRGHRRDVPPNFVPDIASWVQYNPGSTTQAKYTGIFGKLVYESAFSTMLGETDYEYQPNVPAGAIRVTDPVLSTADYAAPYREELPNSRTEFDNAISYAVSGRGGEHVLKAGVQYGRPQLLDQFWVNGDMYLVYNNGKPTSITIFNTPTAGDNVENLLGFFAQDSWTIASRLTLNLGFRFDTNRGYIPARTNPAGTWVPQRTFSKTDVLNQKIGVWRAGVVYDPVGDGRTAFKGSYSRYALQVGVDRVQNVNPLYFTQASCPWNDANGNGKADPGEIGTCSGFPGLTSHYASADGPKWPYSDELMAGVERQIGKDVRLGVMYYRRMVRNQLGLRNIAVPTSAYTPVTVTVPGGATGPGGTATVYNLNPAYFGLQNNILDNDPYLDTTYNGLEVTASKHFSNRWQMTAGLTIGQNKGGINAPSSAQGYSTTADLNDPNNTTYPTGIVGFDSKVAFRLSGSYHTPGDVIVSGSLISNGGFPYVSTYTVNRSIYPGLTRSSQNVYLTERGTERRPTVTMLDLRVARAFTFAGGREFQPQIDLFNITNVPTVVGITAFVGSSYLKPTEIVAPRIIRVGFSVNF
jgi:hypothetical protein